MLNDLVHDFTRIANRASIPLFCFFEQYKSDITKPLKSRNSLLPEYRELVVDESSGSIEGFPKLGLPCDHFQINRFADPSDQNFQFIREEIAKFVHAANEKVALRLQAAPIIQSPTLVHDERDLIALNALFLTDPSIDIEKIQNQKDKLLDDTGAWILSDAAFTTWLNVSFDTTLWIHGDPGKGKTMLAISLIQELSNRILLEGSASTTSIAFFFCDSKDLQRNTATAILRGLIYQLICHRPSLCVFLRDQYEKQRDQLFTSVNSLHALWQIFRTITQQIDHQVYVVIDALDECEGESLESILRLLEPEIASAADGEPPGYSSVKSTSIKWLLTSRNELVIQQGLAGSLEISLEDNHDQVEDSVHQFIGTKIEQLRRKKSYSAELAIHVEQMLREKAGGTFLWVALACKELSKPSVGSLNTKSVLQKLPSGIMPLYGSILQNIIGFEDQDIAQYAKSILRSMVVAFRPMTLVELAIAADLPQEHRHNLPLLKEYVNVCSSMVTVREDVAYFVHLSAKTYILSNGLGSVLSLDIRVDHRRMTLNCFTYLLEDLSRGSAKTDLQRPKPEYPTLFWIQHASHSPDDVAESFNLDAEFFHRDSKQRQLWLDEYWIRSHAKWESKPQRFTATHLVCYAGLKVLLERLLARPGASEIGIKDSLGNTPLLWAAKYGFTKGVSLLVENGADVAAENGEGMTALQWAAGNGYEVIVQYLFENNASIDTTDKNGWSPLHRAAYNGYLGVVKLLVKLGADIEALDGATWTALHRAATMGQINVVRYLMEVDASITPLDREGMTPVLHAAWAGQHNVVQHFIEAGMDVNSSDFNRWTSLHNAAWNGHVPVVKFLLSRNANLEAKNKDGNTALHQAAWSGHPDVVKALLIAGADPDSKAYDENETPLQQAAWHGHFSCVDGLLQAGASVNMQNAVGHTALHHAASNGHESVVRLLLDHKANRNITDKHGQTAEALAESNEHNETVRTLKEAEDFIVAASATPSASVESHALDESVAAALQVEVALSVVEPHGAPGFFVPERITTVQNGQQKKYYMKSGSNRELFESEFMSLTRLHETVPTLAPRPVVWGKFNQSETYFLVTEWVDEDALDDGSLGTGLTLAQKIAKLHTTEAPTPDGHQKAMFGFPITTYCGSTPQKNDWSASWPHFYAERLRFMCRLIEENHGTDRELTILLEQLTRLVVPHLLGNGRLGGKQGIKPVLLHGDLWEGNRSKGKFDYRSGMEPVTYDPACCYGHSEFELGLMRMFGGFSAGLFNEYHHLVPKCEPKKEYDDRISLYELYHYLNHYAIYSGGYREDAIESMRKLCAKYAKNWVPSSVVDLRARHQSV